MRRDVEAGADGRVIGIEPTAPRVDGIKAETIRVTGTVQGVGFRPAVWQLARECGLLGEVCNDAEGVLIHAWGQADSLDTFVARLQTEAPPLAHIERITRAPLRHSRPPAQGFRIVASREGRVSTEVTADAASCPACLAEVMDPADRRYRYPFTNCTHCGPRLSIIRAIPYDRANTSMGVFSMCPDCRAEYADPADRRFHAQPNACPVCGPKVWLEDAAGQRISPEAERDAIETAAGLIRRGAIVAIKGLGGVHLACDASNEEAVDRLRKRKHRYHKALALMARDLEMVARFALLEPAAAALLNDKAAPILVLPKAGEALAPGIAPKQSGLGFMLPYTPLHHLLMREMTAPIVLTSGNRSDEPQAIDNRDARQRLGGIADYFLLHDRDIVNRLDDSVLRIACGAPRFLRRARGYAPQGIRLHEDFRAGERILAMGGELKNTFCLLAEGKAILSQHMGDLEDAATHRDYRHNLRLYRQLFDFDPKVIGVDRHPNYLSSKLGRAMAREEGLALIEIQHHHAHVASCMAEQGMGLDGPRVLGVALDGLGYGEDGSIWGGEFLLVDYHGFERLAHFDAVPMLGGAQAMYEPWRNTFAHLWHGMEWERLAEEHADLDIIRFLRAKPLEVFRAMAERGLNSPPASSAGRLFDAVAAALGVCRETAGFEGQAAIELEALAEAEFDRQAEFAYGYELRDGCLRWAPLWTALLEDLAAAVPADRIAARFHQGVARAVSETATRLCEQHAAQTVVLCGGVYQNRLLLERTQELLRDQGLQVLSPTRLPANDGGLSLGQAAIAFARHTKGAAPGSSEPLRR